MYRRAAVEDVRQSPCPRCGQEADVSFGSQRVGWVEVSCPNCGLLEMTQEEFDVAVADIVEQEERREANP